MSLRLTCSRGVLHLVAWLLLAVLAPACGTGESAPAASPFDEVTTSNAALATGNGEVEVRLARIPASAVPDSGIAVWLGRFLEPVDYREDARAVLVIGHELWQQLGGEPDVVGSTFDLDGTPRVLIGVATPGWAEPAGADAWIPR